MSYSKNMALKDVDLINNSKKSFDIPSERKLKYFLIKKKEYTTKSSKTLNS